MFGCSHEPVGLGSAGCDKTGEPGWREWQTATSHSSGGWEVHGQGADRLGI